MFKEKSKESIQVLNQSQLFLHFCKFLRDYKEGLYRQCLFFSIFVSHNVTSLYLCFMLQGVYIISCLNVMAVMGCLADAAC
jgi:hypothetical protein